MIFLLPSNLLIFFLFILSCLSDSSPKPKYIQLIIMHGKAPVNVCQFYSKKLNVYIKMVADELSVS